MEQPTYEKCHYLSSGQCPYKSTIERVLLIPQLLDPTQITDAKRLCEKCGRILVKRRKTVRVERPLRVVVTRGEREEIFHGTILNVSSGGALVKLDDLPNFHVDEIFRLKIHASGRISDESNPGAISVDGAVKRLDENKNEVAFAFVEESNLENIANI